MSKIDGRMTELDGTAAELKGIQCAISWGRINPTGSEFFFDDIDAVLANLSSKGKLLLLMLSAKSFTSAPAGLEAPADLFDKIVETNSGWWARVDEAAVMDRFIACLEAIATRYDSHPNFEAILTTEPVPSFGGVGVPAGYTADGLADQLIRMYGEAAGIFAKINVAPSINHLADRTLDLLQACYDHRIGMASPDTREVDAWLLYEGTSTTNPVLVPPMDYRGSLARISTVSQSSWSNTQRDTAGIIDFAQAGAITHAAWIDQAVVGGDGLTHTWDETKAALLADPAVNTACPTRYLGCEV